LDGEGSKDKNDRGDEQGETVKTGEATAASAKEAGGTGRR
jgi:hypothetical protein